MHLYAELKKQGVDPDQLASQKPVDQDLHCFQTKYLGSVWLGIDFNYFGSLNFLKAAGIYNLFFCGLNGAVIIKA